MDFSEFEKRLVKIGLTKKVFSNFIGIDYSTVIKWKSNKNIPRYAEVIVNYLIIQQNICEELKKIKENS